MTPPLSPKEGAAPIHCDEYVDSPSANPSLRWFLFIERLPAVLKCLVRERGIPEPRLFADYRGARVRVVMASRFGDVGITYDLAADRGYSARVAVQDLSNFAETP